MESGQLFRMYKNADTGVFQIFSGSKLLLLKEEEPGVFALSCTEAEFADYWANYLDEQTDYVSLYKTICKTPGYFRDCAVSSEGIRVLNQDLFEMMISFIISQQKRIPEIRKCIEALCKRFGEPFEYDGETFYSFPSPEKIAAAGPSGVCGLSLGYRERYIYESSIKYLEDDFIKSPEFRTLSYTEAKKHLLTYCGIGEKVANCICLFALGYKDAFPVDVHIKDILHREFGIGDESYRTLPDAAYAAAVDRIFEGFSDVKGIIQQWMFAKEISVRQ